jgi:hypothetical protein
MIARGLALPLQQAVLAGILVGLRLPLRAPLRDGHWVRLAARCLGRQQPAAGMLSAVKKAQDVSPGGSLNPAPTGVSPSRFTVQGPTSGTKAIPVASAMSSQGP